MRKTLVLIMIFIALGPFLALGCSDNDDNQTIVSSDPSTVWIDGIAGFDQTSFLQMTIYPRGGQVSPVERVQFGDSLCDIVKQNNTGIADPMFLVDFGEDAASSMYSDGALAHVVVSGGGKSSECFLRLLGPANKATILAPNGDTAVQVGAGVQVDWNDVDSTDWYAIRKVKVWDSTGTTVTTIDYLFTYVSGFQIANTEVTSLVQFFDLQIVPVAGSSPEETAGNWTGDMARGKIYSYGDGDAIHVGVISTAANKALPQTNAVSESIAPGDVVEGVYSAYNKIR